jgi:hypothetical protein
MRRKLTYMLIDTDEPPKETYREGDIVIRHHPKSGKNELTLSPEQYKEFKYNRSKSVEEPPPDEDPWLPFGSREEFEFAELVHNAKLNKKQIKKLLNIIHRTKKNPDSFWMRSYQDLKNSLNDASKLLTTVISISHSF